MSTQTQTRTQTDPSLLAEVAYAAEVRYTEAVEAFLAAKVTMEVAAEAATMASLAARLAG